MANNTTSLNTPYLLLTGAVIIAVVFLFVVLQPMMDNANEIRHGIAVDKATLQDKQDFYGSLNTKIAQLAGLATAERQLAVVLPETDRTQDIIRVINEYGTQAGITVVAVANNSSVSDAQASAQRARGEVINIPSGVRTLEFEVGATGGYEQVRLFLTLLGKSPRVIDVSGVSLKQLNGQPGQVTATIKMQLYSQQPTQAAGA